MSTRPSIRSDKGTAGSRQEVAPALRHLCSQSLPPSMTGSQMHQYNVGAPFGRITINVAGPFARSDQENRYFLIAMDCFTKWQEDYAIPNQEASTVAGALVTDFICRFGIPWELRSDQRRNFEPHLIQEVLQRLGVNKTHNTLVHPQSDSMVERTSKRSRSTCDWSSHRTEGIRMRDYLSFFFFFACRASTHNSRG
jgi:transposase InsO family protein